MSSEPFGPAIPGLAPAEILAAEATAGRDSRFADLDNLVAAVLRRAFAGHPVLTGGYGKGTGRADTLELAGVDAAARPTVDDRFAVPAQEQRGAWYIPDHLSLKVGWPNFAGLAKAEPRFAVNAAREQVVKVETRTSPTAVFAWAVLIPLFSDLFAPVDLRTDTGKLLPAEDRRARWADIDALYADLGLDMAEPLAVMRYGGPWGRLRAPEQLEARQALVAALASQVSADTARRWRARTTRALTAAYYAKAKRGRPLARTVLTKANQAPLSAFFGGDWLAYLDYLGEQPNDAEQVTTALPEPRLYVGAAARAAAVAAETGLPVDEVERMLATAMGTAGTSPVEERLAVLRRWWGEFDRVHAAQRPRSANLVGLVDEGDSFVVDGKTREPRYRRLLPAELVADIDRLWDGMTLPRWPERIASEFFPHRLMAETFGGAVQFWHGVALTCWFNCEGPSARAGLGDLAEYYARDVKSLTEAGFPVDPGLFDELKAAERRLGPPEEITDRSEEAATAVGVTVTISMSRGSRRAGFEILRDIVTAHRRAWAAQHLDGYLHHRWESELRAVSREYSRALAAKGKPPTVRQFAEFAAPAANHWFGGDLAALFATLGEKAPMSTARVDLLDGDPRAFVRAVYTALGGGPPLPAEMSYPDHRDEYELQFALRRLASEAPKYLQLYEAIGRPPTEQEFGANRLRWDTLGGLEAGWVRFQAAVESARTGRVVEPPAAAPPPEVPPSQAPSQAAPPRTTEPPAPQRERRGLFDRLRHRR